MRRSSQIDLLLAGANVAVNLIRVRSASLGTGYENVHVARSPLEGHGFANPFFSGPTGPTAHLAPVYPVLLYLQMLAVGNYAAFAIVATLLDIALQSFALLLLPRLAGRLFHTSAPGYVAAGLLVLVNNPTPQVDMALTALLCTFVMLAVCSQAAGATSLLLGLSALTNPATARRWGCAF